MNSNDLPSPDYKDNHFRSGFRTTFHTPELQSKKLAMKDKVWDEQIGSVEGAALPSHETEHSDSPLSTPVDEGMRMTFPHEEPIETEDFNKDKLNGDERSS